MPASTLVAHSPADDAKRGLYLFTRVRLEHDLHLLHLHSRYINTVDRGVFRSRCRRESCTLCLGAAWLLVRFAVVPHGRKSLGRHPLRHVVRHSFSFHDQNAPKPRTSGRSSAIAKLPASRSLLNSSEPPASLPRATLILPKPWCQGLPPRKVCARSSAGFDGGIGLGASPPTRRSIRSPISVFRIETTVPEGAHVSATIGFDTCESSGLRPRLIRQRVCRNSTVDR